MYNDVNSYLSRIKPKHSSNTDKPDKGKVVQIGVFNSCGAAEKREKGVKNKSLFVLLAALVFFCASILFVAYSADRRVISVAESDQVRAAVKQIKDQCNISHASLYKEIQAIHNKSSFTKMNYGQFKKSMRHLNGVLAKCGKQSVNI